MVVRRHQSSMRVRQTTTIVPARNALASRKWVIRSILFAQAPPAGKLMRLRGFSEAEYPLKLKDKGAVIIRFMDGVEDALHIRLQEERGGDLHHGTELKAEFVLV